jgi:negative regulator of sigma E activity
MIETKDTTALFEQLEREFADEHRLMDAAQRDLREVKRLMPAKPSRPSFVRRVMPLLIAGLVSLVVGIGIGLVIQYQQTQDARAQVTQLHAVAAHAQSVALFNAPTSRAQLAGMQALWTVKADRAGALAAQPPATQPARNGQTGPLAQRQGVGERALIWALKADRATRLTG